MKFQQLLSPICPRYATERSTRRCKQGCTSCTKGRRDTPGRETQLKNTFNFLHHRWRSNLKVARVSRGLCRHRRHVSGVVHQQVTVQAQLHVRSAIPQHAELHSVDLPPQPVYEAAGVARGGTGVVVLVLLYVLTVCVVALEKAEAYEFGVIFSGYVLQVRTHRIVVDERFIGENLYSGLGLVKY